VNGGGATAKPRTPVRESIERAELRARVSGAGVGAAVVDTAFRGGAHVWNCIVSDGRRWRYVRVIGEGLGPFHNLRPERVEDGIERFAETLPADGRLQFLLDANPLHIDADGNVGD
jgi:hypothetical protein